jgi:arginine utilization regulatory protein
MFRTQNIEIIMNYVSDGIQEINLQGNIIFCNRAAAVLDDIIIEDVIGRHLLDVYPSLTDKSSTFLKVLKNGIPLINNEQTYTNYKGDQITTVNTTLPVMENDIVVGAIEISRNITDVKVLSERIVDLQSRVYGNKAKLKTDDDASYNFDDIITNNSDLMRLKSIAMKASLTVSPILVCGETGTGKELLVQSIHNSSSRKKNAFIAQNCAALPTNLLEGILFGTVKGGFTGANDRPGLFELADGGTMFLDEINSMPMELQAKILRVIQEGRLRRIGDTKTRSVDVRVIAATNIDPLLAVENKLLRRDLYYRLNTIMLMLPPLKERTEDIPLLTEFFIRKYNTKLYRNVKGITGEVASLFLRYDWPGNVRELEHVIEGAMNIIDGKVITLEDLTPVLRRFHKSKKQLLRIEETSLKEALNQLEHQLIEGAIQEYSGNITKAAQKLDIPRQTLQYKLKKLGIKQV